MTFPTPRTPVFSRDGGVPITSRVVDLPAGIVAGDLMVAVIGSNVSTGPWTAPAGWTFLAGGWGDGDEDGIWWKIAVGGEVSATWTHVSSAQSSWHLGMAFQGAQGPPEYTFVDSSGASSANCPSITPSWGLADNLFVAINYVSDPSDYPSAYPANYTLMQAVEVPAVTTGYRVAARQLAATSEDPASQAGTGVMSVLRNMTMAIRPGITAAIARGGYMMG